MKKVRPVVFVIDKTCGSVLNDAMQALDWVFAEARDRGMGRDVAVVTIGYDFSANLLSEGIQLLDQYFWTDTQRSFAGGYIDEVFPLIRRVFDEGKDLFENPIVVFLCADEPSGFWRNEFYSLESNCPLFGAAHRIALQLGDGEDTDYLWTLAGFDGRVAHTIPELKQMLSAALFGEAERDIGAILRELQAHLDDFDQPNDDWSSGGGYAENARESFLDDEDDGKIHLTIINDLDDDPADEGFGGWGGVENARETFDDDGWASGWGEAENARESFDEPRGYAENARESYYEPNEPQGVSVSEVQFSAVAPKEITKGEYAMIDIAIYEEAYRYVVDRIIAEADSPVRESFGGIGEVRRGAEITVRLSSPDVEIWDDEESGRWNGKYLHFNFTIDVPLNYAKRQILLIATVYFDGVIATRLKMVAHCSTMREQKLSITREDVLRAFVSYASQDRSRVATIVQGMKKARPDMDVFFDVESLRSGEDWELALHREIEGRDVLFLCWSHNARESRWVEVEWRYAMALKGLDAIEPVPLEPPSVCPPPPELSSKHFNDRALLYN